MMVRTMAQTKSSRSAGTREQHAAMPPAPTMLDMVECGQIRVVSRHETDQDFENT